jgi:glutamine---fructose-6-phosphate transaminase (isomerizing)
MNPKDQTYAQFCLVREMLETPIIIKNFHTQSLAPVLSSLKKTKKLFLTGEGSSRILPAKNLTYYNYKSKNPLTIITEGSRQAAELNLSSFTVFGASNSGKTKEVVSLFQKKKLKEKFSLTVFPDSPLAKLSKQAFILNCGKEQAVAATKSVIEQAIFYQNLLSLFIANRKISPKTLNELSTKASYVLEMLIPSNITTKLLSSPILYFSGRNNGAAEEAALKTNEITGKKSVFLEGTYAVHGIEEVMHPEESIILVDPFPEEEQKFKEVLVDGVKMNVLAISNRKTLFPTILIPSMSGFDPILQLLACWNLLVEIGIRMNKNLDVAVRARKIGNEFILKK